MSNRDFSAYYTRPEVIQEFLLEVKEFLELLQQGLDLAALHNVFIKRQVFREYEEIDLIWGLHGFAPVLASQMLLNTLRSSDDIIILEIALRAIQEIKLEAAEKPLLNLLQHKAETIQAETILALGAIKGKLVLPYLSAILNGESENFKSSAAYNGVGKSDSVFK